MIFEIFLILILAFLFLGFVLARKFEEWLLLFLILFLGSFFWKLYKIYHFPFKSLSVFVFQKEFLQFLNFPPKIFLILKSAFLIISAFFVGAIAILMIVTVWLRHKYFYDLKEFFSFKPYGVKKYTKEWQKIEKRLEFDIEPEWKLAVLEAFELLTKALQGIGWRGKDFEEISKILTKEEISNLEELQNLYQIQKDIIADPSLKLEKKDAEKVLKAVKEALTEIGCL